MNLHKTTEIIEQKYNEQRKLVWIFKLYELENKVQKFKFT